MYIYIHIYVSVSAFMLFLGDLADRHAQFRFIPGPQFEPCQFLALHDSRDSWTGHPFRDFCQIHTNLANKMPKLSKCTVVWFINAEFLLQFRRKTWGKHMKFHEFSPFFRIIWIPVNLRVYELPIIFPRPPGGLWELRGNRAMDSNKDHFRKSRRVLSKEGCDDDHHRW